MLLLLACATFPVALVLQGCSGGPDGGGPGTVVSECAADGSDHIYTEKISGETREIGTSFCPNHPTTRINPNFPVPYTGSATYNVPAKPKLEGSSVELNEQGGITGVFFSGAMVFSPYGGSRYGRVTNQANSATVVEGDTFDQCGCHASSRTAPSYHCHVAPSCLLSQLNAEPSSHSPQLGWAVDGFPIYGPRGKDGKLMVSCSAPGATAPCADECGGLEDDSVGDGFKYRYYMMGETKDGTTCTTPASEATPWPGSNEDYYPNVPVCYRGCCPAGAECNSPSGHLWRRFRTCSGDAVDGFTEDPTVPYPNGLGRYEDACWDDTVAGQSTASTEKMTLIVGIAVALLALGAAGAVFYARGSRMNPHVEMTEVEESPQM